MYKFFKKFLRLCIPPIVQSIHYRLPLNNFHSYWKKNKNRFKNVDKNNKKTIGNEIFEITEAFINSNSYKLISNFWQYLNIKNYNSIIKNGLENYSQTISTNYYTFLEFNENSISETVKNIENVSIDYKINLFKKHNLLNYEQSLNHNLILLLIYENLKKTDSFSLLGSLNDETYLGYNDPFLEIGQLKVTQDKINSLLDYDTIKQISNFSNKDINVLEIGAGSGRTSEALLTFKKDLTYVVCDIPLAIIISYKRLTKAFPNKKISILFNVNNITELEEAILANDISFIFPHQLKLFSKKFFDLVLAIDCLHEMDKKTVKLYFNQINICSKYLYFSVWKKTNVPYSLNTYEFDKNHYAVPSNWELIFKNSSIFPSNFWNICYKTT